MINEKDFLEAGFLKTEDNLFLYYKELVSKKEAEKHDIDEDEIPTLVFGTTGVGSGFAIYTGTHFIWIDCTTPEDAVNFANKIVSFEPLKKKKN